MPDMHRARTRLPYYCALVGILMLQAAPAPLPAREPAPAPVMTESAARAETPIARTASTPRPRPAPVQTVGQALSELRIHRELPITQWLRPGEYAWNDDGVPAGPVTIVVNIRSRTLSAYRAGVEIGR